MLIRQAVHAIVYGPRPGPLDPAKPVDIPADFEEDPADDDEDDDEADDEADETDVGESEFYPPR